MTVCVYLVIALLIITKLCDVLSTLHRNEKAHSETNPIAKHMMICVGTKKAIWLVFLLALIIIGIAGISAINGNMIMKALFICAGAAISFIQGAVAYCNWTGKDNAITKHIRIMHSSFHQLLRK